MAGAERSRSHRYNAGLSTRRRGMLADFSWLCSCERVPRELATRRRRQHARNTYRAPKVHGSSPIIPFPTIAAATKLGRNDQWTIAGGALRALVPLSPRIPPPWAAGLSPARYALGSFDGSALVMVGGWAAIA